MTSSHPNHCLRMHECISRRHPYVCTPKLHSEIKFSYSAHSSTEVAVATEKVQGTPKITVCSGPDAHIKDIKYAFDPPAPVKGQSVTVTGSGTLDKTVTAGTYTLDVYALGIHVLNHNHSVCGQDTINLPLGMGTITLQGLDCPASGPITIKEVVPIPTSVPSGTITAKFRAVDDSQEELVCANLEITL